MNYQTNSIQPAQSINKAASIFTALILGAAIVFLLVNSGVVTSKLAQTTPQVTRVVVEHPRTRVIHRTVAPVATAQSSSDAYYANRGYVSSAHSSCGGTISVGPNTSCAFAQNVFEAYRASGPGIVTVYSPVTHQTYDMNCGGREPVTCTGGNSASVYFD